MATIGKPDIWTQLRRARAEVTRLRGELSWANDRLKYLGAAQDIIDRINTALGTEVATNPVAEAGGGKPLKVGTGESTQFGPIMYPIYIYSDGLSQKGE